MIRLFGHYIYKAFLLLGLLEFLVTFGSLFAGYYLRFNTLALEDESTHTGVGLTALVFSLLVSFSMIAVGLYQRGLPFTAGLLVRVILSFVFASTVLSLLFYLIPDLFLGRGVIAYAILFALTGVLALRSVFYRTSGADARNHRILVLGCGKNAMCIHRLEEQPLGLQIVGYVRMEEQADSEIPKERLFSLDKPLLDLVVELEADGIVLAVDDRRRRLPVEDILDCKMSGIAVLDLLSFFEKETSLIKIDILQPSWMIFSDGFTDSSVTQIVKRLVDLLGAVVLLLISAPFMLLTALAIYLESGLRGPIFYHQVRVGLHGQEFWLHKFRSMRTDAEADGKARMASKNDSRITRVGAFIRKTRLDELPQIFNVLRGEMSLVGPRPERPHFVDQFNESIPYYRERHRVKPGVTGWAQLCYQYGDSAEDAKMKLQYDLYYVKNASVFLDMIILLETVEVVLWGKGAR